MVSPSPQHFALIYLQSVWIMTPRFVEADGIVLDSNDYGESDLIVTVYCRESGKITAIAKGAKKSKRRFVNKLELFSFLHVYLRQQNNRSLAFLEEADLHAGFIHIRKDIAAYTAASVIREFCLFGIREGEGDEQIYRLLLWSLHKLDQGEPHLQIVMIFLVRFYDYLGYRPELGRCFRCGTDRIDSGDIRFSTATGGLLCPSCTGSTLQRGLRMSAGTMKMLHSCQDTPLERLQRLRIPEQSLYEALKILHHYGKHILQRDIISWNMLRKSTFLPRQASKGHR